MIYINCMKNDCGVYEIICDDNSMRYIGSSENITRRLEQHFYLLQRNNHYCGSLQADYNLYGEEKFYGEMVEICKNIKIAIAKEKLFIAHENPDNLYNCRNLNRGKNNKIVQFNIRMNDFLSDKLKKISHKHKMTPQSYLRKIIRESDV